jgi:hypothetical protein
MQLANSLTSLMQDPKTFVSLISALIAGTSLYLNRRFWQASNRPIISVSVVTNRTGNVSASFNLAVYNSGTRPATSIQLYAERQKLAAILTENATEDDTLRINNIFSDTPVISLLINGKETSGGFGTTSIDSKNNILKYGATLPIKVRYSDLEGNHYLSRQVLTIKHSESFTGLHYSSQS